MEIENAMVVGEYDDRPEMTDDDEEQLICDMEEELCNEKLDVLIEDLTDSEDFTRAVVAALLSDSRDKLYDINGIFDRHLRLCALSMVNQ